MTPADLRAVGTALYGESHWVALLSESLGVNKRTVRKWANGDVAIPDWLPERLDEVRNAAHCPTCGRRVLDAQR